MSEAKKKTTAKKTAKKPRIKKVEVVKNPNLEKFVEETSIVKEVSSLGGNVSEYVPKSVLLALNNKHE